MQLTYVYRPIQFFLITFLVTWIFWFIAAYFSFQKDMGGIQLLLMLLGLVVPFCNASFMIYGSKNNLLIRDFWSRLYFRGIKSKFLCVILLLMPFVLLLATVISLLFGHSINQFMLSNEYTVMKGKGVLLSLLILLFASTVEELGWRGYGVDSIRSKFNLFVTTILFACLWAMWHVPLFFINGYYQHELWNTSIIYVINFFVSVLPVTILINWVYYKNNRNIVMTILFHFMLNLFSSLFQTEQFTKCIVTVLLAVISFVVIVKNERFFFTDTIDELAKLK